MMRRILPALAGLFFISTFSSCAERPVIGAFSITLTELREIAQDLPPDAREAVLARPADFLLLMAGVLDEPQDLFVLVDKENSLFADYVPPDLVGLDDYGLNVTRSGLLLRQAVMPAVMEMTETARLSGIEITFSSAYRSYERQAEIYDREVKTYGRETADRESARPGHSQHQLGTVIDFGSISDGYEATPEGAWVAEHAGEYGFSLSYPDGYEAETGYRYESWHYRYITRPGARMQQEYFGNVQQYFLEFLNAHGSYFEEKRVHGQ